MANTKPTKELRKAFDEAGTKQTAVINTVVEQFNPTFLCEEGVVIDPVVFKQFFGSKCNDIDKVISLATDNIDTSCQSVGWVHTEWVQNNNGKREQAPNYHGMAFVVAKIEASKSLILLTSGHNVCDSRIDFDIEGTDFQITEFVKGQFCSNSRIEKHDKVKDSILEFKVEKKYSHKVEEITDDKPDDEGVVHDVEWANDFAIIRVDNVPEQLSLQTWQNTKPLFPVFPDAEEELIACIGIPGNLATITNVYSQGSAADDKEEAKFKTPTDAKQLDELKRTIQKLFNWGLKRQASIGETKRFGLISYHSASTIGGFSGAPVISLANYRRSFYGISNNGAGGDSFNQQNRNVFIPTTNKYFQKMYKDFVQPHITNDVRDDLAKSDPTTAKKFADFEAHLNKEGYAEIHYDS